ncbi:MULTISPECIES: hypothetical protein [Bacillus]|nr:MULTISPECIES: hypothetical protein [Bacillus]AJO16365.1 hypothetical protein SC10_B2orf00305 [Bacillus paralicheniformis]KAA0836825.1 hypothetical protein EI979_14820 [Bacillus paralicheniformis]KAA0839477.1 hypothetical protein EI977_12140 [Bacillus paralicheniformis]KFM90225.1 hypothetical protein DJ88_2098 [Bacillus paralicheniformis]MBU5330045.1 hypothetical protein [Bacillus paralicheniformis]
MEQLKSRIKKAMIKKGLIKPCTNCNHDEAIIIDPYVRLDLQDYSSVLNVRPEAIPSVAVVCAGCGKIDLYAAKVLMPSEFI